jgi:hypothetical protein
MLRSILAVLLSVATAHAGFFFPTWTTPSQTATSTHATQVWCGEFIPLWTETVTQVAWGSSGGPGVCDVGWYPAGGGSAITRASDAGAVDCDGTPSTITATGLSATLTAGQEIRMCWCSSGTSGSYIGIATTAAGGPEDQMNAFVVNVGQDNTNTCSSGVLPAATGALTNVSNFNLLLAWWD